LSYLISVYSNIKSTSGHKYIRVRQTTIAKKCGIKSAQTVAKVTAALMAKGYLSHILAAYRADGRKGTYTYVLSPELLKSAYYTKISRSVFNYGFSAEQLKIYFFIIKCIDPKLGYMFNSFNDIAKALKMKRSKVMAIISKLVEMRRVHKMRKMRDDNSRVFADNRYSIKIIRLIKKRLTKKLQPLSNKGCNKSTFSFANNKVENVIICKINNSTKLRCCQYLKDNFCDIFLNKGGGYQNLRSIYKPVYLTF